MERLRDTAGRESGWSDLSGADDSFGLGGAGHDGVERLTPGTRLDGVTLGSLLASGGMGSVYEAWQDAPRRRVAVKLMRRRGHRGDFVRRFAREVDVLAGLRHPHIAHIHTCGLATLDGAEIPYFVMELVPEAESITRYVERHALSTRDRVALFAQVCAAVAHAHGRGVIHRDLKPANILVGGDGTPKVIDFGLARLVAGDDSAGSAVAPAGGTVAGELVGTLQYMSPEQIVGSPEIDGRCDVYALGLVLHELIAGRRPYDLEGRAYPEAVRIVTGSTAARSAAVELAAAHDCPSHQARPLGVITSTCLEAEAADRYQTAASLEADVARWLADRPILARPATPWESARRFARRHRGTAGAATAAVAALLTAVVGISLLSLRAERLRHEAERQAAASRAELYRATVLLAADARGRDTIGEARRLVREARGLVAGEGGPPLELRCLEATLDEAREVIDGNAGTVAAVAWAPDGTWLALGDAAGHVRLHRPGVTGTAAVVLGRHESAIWSLAVSPDARWLASAAADGTVRIWNVATGELIATLTGHEATVYAVAFAADGRTLASASRDQSVRLWDTDTWQERQVLREHSGTVYTVRFSPDGTRLVTASLDRTARVWDAATGATVTTLEGHAQRVFSAAFSADGRRVVTASEDGTARIWDAATGTELRRFAHPGRVNAAVFIGATDRVATAGADSVLRIWNAGTHAAVDSNHAGSEGDTPPDLIGQRPGHAAAIWTVAATDDGGLLATGSADGTVRVWDGNVDPATVMRESGRVHAAAVSPDGGLLAVGLADGAVVLRDTRAFAPRGRLTPGGGRINGVAFSPDGRALAAAADDGSVSLWNAATLEREPAAAAHPRRVYSVAFSADGGRFVTAAEDRTARVWHAATAAAIGPPLRHPRRVLCAAFIPDGSVITACEDRLIRIWDAEEGGERRRFAGHSGQVNWVAVSPDGEQIASASSDGTVRLWSMVDGRPIAVLTGPARQVWKVAYAPDGSRLAGVSADGTVHLWDWAATRAVLALRGHADQAWALAFAPDGSWLATGAWDATTRVWGLAAAEIARRDHRGCRSSSSTNR